MITGTYLTPHKHTAGNVTQGGQSEHPISQKLFAPRACDLSWANSSSKGLLWLSEQGCSCLSPPEIMSSKELPEGGEMSKEPEFVIFGIFNYMSEQVSIFLLLKKYFS